MLSKGHLLRADQYGNVFVYNTHDNTVELRRMISRTLNNSDIRYECPCHFSRPFTEMLFLSYPRAPYSVMTTKAIGNYMYVNFIHTLQ